MNDGDSPLYLDDEPDEDGMFLLYFLRNGATVKCGYIYADAAADVRRLLTPTSPSAHPPASS